MTDWYWQNQQLVYLDKWHKAGLRNICEVKKVRAVRPLLFIHRNDDIAHEGSLLVVSLTAKMKDYRVQGDTDKVVEGDRKFKDHVPRIEETVLGLTNPIKTDNKQIDTGSRLAGSTDPL
jgi:hypothetical protein